MLSVAKSDVGAAIGKADDQPSGIDEVSSRISKILKDFCERATAVEFCIEEEGQEVVIKVVNRSTGELIRQIPPESLLRASERLMDLQGVLFDQES